MIAKRLQMVKEGKQEMYKLVMLDYSLEDGMDGPLVAIKIREMMKDYPGKRVYICCCTAYDGQTVYNEAMASGMDDFITKPITFDKLSDLLKKI